MIVGAPRGGGGQSSSASRLWATSGGVPGRLPGRRPGTTGQIMELRVVPAVTPDPTTPPMFLQLPTITPLPAATVTRPLALLERPSAFFDGPAVALLGTVAGDPNLAPGVADGAGMGGPRNGEPGRGHHGGLGLYNASADAHPIHIHEVAFEVVNRQDIFIDEDTSEVQVVPGSVPTQSSGRPASKTASSPTQVR